MDMKMPARFGALVFLAVAIVATAIESGRKDVEPSPSPSASSGEPNLLRAEMVRCQMLGEAGIRDAACLRAWAESRRRFMAPPSTTSEEPIRRDTQPATITPQSE